MANPEMGICQALGISTRVNGLRGSTFPGYKGWCSRPFRLGRVVAEGSKSLGWITGMYSQLRGWGFKLQGRILTDALQSAVSKG